MATNPIWVTLITASLGGYLTLVGVMITQRQARLREDARWYRECEREQTRWTRDDAARSEERTQQRLADSYLEVLRIVEREGQWVEATAIEIETAVLRWICQENYPEGPGLGGLKKLLEVLQPTEVAARQALADAVAEELGPGSGQNGRLG